MIQRRRRYSINTRFIFFVLIVVVFIVAAVFLVASPVIKTLKAGQISAEGINDGVLLFQEQIITLPEYDEIQYIANDLALVTAKDTIATVYEPGYVVSAVKDLGDLQRNIVAYQNNTTTKDIYKPELAQIDFDIEKAIKALQNSELNDVSFTVLNKNLTALMEQRQQYIRDNFSPDATLQQLYADQSARMEALAGWQSQVTAGADGYLSWYTDGYEELLKITEIASIKHKTLDEIIKKSAQGVTPVQTQDKAKIIQKDHCFLAASFDENKSFTIGQELSLYASCDDTVYNATVYYINAEDGYLVYFEIKGDISGLAGKRTVQFSTQPINSGFVLPNSYIKSKDSQPYIYASVNGEKTKISIKILAQDSRTTAFEPLQKGELVLGQTVYSK